MRLAAVEYCYDASAAAATLTAAISGVFTQSAGGSGGEEGPALIDATSRDDSACRVLTAPTPIALGPHDVLTLTYQVQYSAVGSFLAGRTSFVLEP
jgi:hypothetical protein